MFVGAFDRLGVSGIYWMQVAGVVAMLMICRDLLCLIEWPSLKKR